MLPIFPFIAWAAPLTSAFLLIALWNLGELAPQTGAVLLGWFVVAGYCQFFGGSAVLGLAGLLGQTVLAIVLIFRWKLSG